MHAYFPALNSYPSLLGDMLADGINCLGFTWVIDLLQIYNRAVVSGGAEGTLAPPEFGSSINPIPTVGADYAHPTIASTLGFQNLTTALYNYSY